MNKIIVGMSFFIAVILLHSGIYTKAQMDDLKIKNARLQADNLKMEQKIKDKEYLVKHPARPISTEYGAVLNQIRFLESYSGTSMEVQLEGASDTEDIASHYEDTEYKDIKGLRIRIVVDKFSKETDMGAVLDDIHLLEKNTDFMASEISKDNNDLIVKGEVYGI